MSKPKRKPTRARIDTGKVHPRDLVDRVYSNDFPAQLARRFDFALTDEVEAELRHMAFVYIMNRRDDGGEDPWSRERKRFQKLRAAVLTFMETVREFEDDDIATELYYVARGTKIETSLSMSFREIHPRVPHYRILYRHLSYVLDMLGEAAGRGADRYKIPRGPRRNEGLYAITAHAIALWEVDFGRRFTIDYHRGSGLTESFQFIRALIDPLDDVTDQQIITSMREAIRTWRGSQKKKGDSADMPLKSL